MSFSASIAVFHADFKSANGFLPSLKVAKILQNIEF